jgi:hypothetical protein
LRSRAAVAAIESTTFTPAAVAGDVGTALGVTVVEVDECAAPHPPRANAKMDANSRIRGPG